MIKSHPPQWSNYYFLHGHGVLTQFFYCNYGARDLVSYPLRMAYSIYDVMMGMANGCVWLMPYTGKAWLMGACG